MKIAVMVSGGVDSLVAYHLAIDKHGKENVKPIFVNCHQPYLDKELQAISNLFSPGEVIIVNADLCESKLDNVPSIEQQEIYGRNLLIAFYGSLLGDRVWLSILETEMNPTAVRDKHPEFLHMASALLTYLMKGRRMNTVVETPFASLTKTEVVKLGLDLGITKDQFLRTVSCYDETLHSCGRCSTCFKRWVAFVNNNIFEEHAHSINKNGYGRQIVGEMRALAPSLQEMATWVSWNPRFSKKRMIETHNALLRGGGTTGIFPHDEVMPWPNS